MVSTATLSQFLAVFLHLARYDLLMRKVVEEPASVVYIPNGSTKRRDYIAEAIGMLLPHQGGWIKMFKDSGSEIEHEAFLALWLSRFVFLSSSDVVVKSLCIVVVCLARGVRIALAPAVLASVYKDLSFLKDKIGLDEMPIIVRAPMQLVQIWIWERFPKISPKCEIGCNPRFSRWEKTNVCVDDVGSFVDYCAFEDFIWQSYVKDSNENLGFSEVYQEMGRCVIVGDCLHEELESWSSDSVWDEPDVPADVARVNGTHEIAWKFYTMLVKDAMFYIPLRLSEPYVTARYLEWRNKATGECSEVIGKYGSRSDSGDGISTLVDLEAKISKLEEEFAYIKSKKAEKC
ncbi:aminotransferase-like mobile domain-containing protein [Tanacetum coccineum]